MGRSILDHILQDQSLDHSLVLDQDQDHTPRKKGTGELLCTTLSKIIIIPANSYGLLTQAKVLNSLTCFSLQEPSEWICCLN